MRSALRWGATAGLALSVAIGSGCNRNLEPLVPGEKPRTPDLSKIFPEPVEEQEPQGRRGAPPVGSEEGDSSSLIRGRVELAPELADAQPAGSVLFIIARRAGKDGGPPLAVRRIPAPRLPFDFEIGPSDMMVSGLPFAGEFQISAHLDTDGNPTTLLPGDLLGDAGEALTPGTGGVSIILDRRL